MKLVLAIFSVVLSHQAIADQYLQPGQSVFVGNERVYCAEQPMTRLSLAMGRYVIEGFSLFLKDPVTDAQGRFTFSERGWRYTCDDFGNCTTSGAPAVSILSRTSFVRDSVVWNLERR